MKSFKSLPTLALAVAVGIAAAALAASPADAQRAKATKAATSPEARAKMCQDRYKGMYRSQHDDHLVLQGFCLSNIVGWR